MVRCGFAPRSGVSGLRVWQLRQYRGPEPWSLVRRWRRLGLGNQRLPHHGGHAESAGICQ